MAQTVELRENCGGCGATGQQPLYPEGSLTCFMCEGTGKRLVGYIEIDVPTTAQFTAKFQEIADALQAIWNKVNTL